MNKFLTINKFLILPIIVVACFSLTPKAQAQWITFDPTNWIQTTSTAFSTAATAITSSANTLVSTAGWTYQNIISKGLDALAYQAGQLILDQLTENTINWIKGGFNGSPSFNVDAGKLLNDLIDAVAGDLANQIRGLAMCDFMGNFQFDLANHIALSSRSDYRNKFKAQARCPFPPNFNLTQFTNDFSKGGWTAFENSLYDSGNTFGMSILAGEELALRRAEQIAKQQQKLTQSGGFLDFVDTNNCPEMEKYPELQKMMAGPDFPPAAKKAYQKAYCKTTTPGKVVGDALGKTLGVDMDRIGFVDNINKIIGAIIRQIASQAMTGIFSSGTQSSFVNSPTSASAITRQAIIDEYSQATSTLSNTLTTIAVKTAADSDALMATPIKEQVAPDAAVISLQNTVNGNIVTYRTTLNALSIFILSGMGIYDGEGAIYPQITEAQAAKEAINPTLNPTYPLVTALTNLQDKQLLALQTTKLGFERLKLQMTTTGRAAALAAINAEDQVLAAQTALGVANATYQTALNNWLSALMSLSVPLPQPPVAVTTAKLGVDTAITTLTTAQGVQALASQAAIAVLLP